MEWEVYVRTQIARCKTDSWLFVPLLLEALGVPHRRHDGFERPERWSVFVDRYRNALREARISAGSVVVNEGAYIDAHEQERLMDLDRIAADHIGMWIVKVRWGGARSVVPPLPEIDAAACAFAFE